jgi:hypothetical protein
VVKVVICAQGIGVQIGLGVVICARSDRLCSREVTGCGKSGDMCSRNR